MYAYKKAFFLIINLMLVCIFSVYTQEYELPKALAIEADNQIYPIGWSEDETHFAYIDYSVDPDGQAGYWFLISDVEKNQEGLTCRYSAVDEEKQCLIEIKKYLKEYNIVKRDNFKIMKPIFEYEGLEYDIVNRHESGVFTYPIYMDNGEFDFGEDEFVAWAEISIQSRLHGSELDQTAVFKYKREHNDTIKKLSAAACVISPNGKFIIFIVSDFLDGKGQLKKGLFFYQTESHTESSYQKTHDISFSLFAGLWAEIDDQGDATGTELCFGENNEYLMVICNGKKEIYPVTHITKHGDMFNIKLENGKNISTTCISKIGDPDRIIIQLTGFIHARYVFIGM
jgi:hypothetical protein